MAFKMRGFNGYQNSPIKQKKEECYIDENGNKVCPSVLDENPFKPKNKKTKKKKSDTKKSNISKQKTKDE